MKKIAMLLAIVLLVAAPLTAYAASPRLKTINPEITFSGTTANCSVVIVANNISEEITATIKLWHGTSCLETWYASGDGYIFWDDTAIVTKGNTYVLTVDAVIDGDVMDRVSTSGNCA